MAKLIIPVMTARPYKDGSAYYVLLEWPDGSEQQVDDFRSEGEAVAWIENSEAWLKKHPKNQS